MAVAAAKESGQKKLERQIEKMQAALQVAQASAARGERLTSGLRAVMAATDELLAASDMDDLLRRAVECGRRRLGLERCGLHLLAPDGAHFQGTYGTDLNGATIDERDLTQEKNAVWEGYLQATTSSPLRWAVLHDQKLWHGGHPGSKSCKRGWVAMSLIHSSERAPLGLLFNDTALTGAALDEVQQELVAVYCAQLGSIIERRRSEQALRVAEEKFRSIFENAIEGIYQTTPEGCYLSANPALARIYGYDSPEQLIAAGPDIVRTLYVDPKRRQEFVRLLRVHGIVVEFESQKRRKDGQIIWVMENARAVFDAEGKLLLYEGSTEDITARKRSERTIEEQKLELQAVNAQLQELATTDPLTGIRNRRAFRQRLREELSAATRYADGGPLSLLMLDVDHFKDYNDSHGHPAGDEVLKKVAQVLFVQARTTDFSARFGGEEFVVVMPHTDRAGAMVMAERIRQAIEFAHWPLRTVTVSIGVTTTDGRINNEESLLLTADEALYQSKRTGRNRSSHICDLPDMGLASPE